MRIVFIDPNTAHEYDAGTPFVRALAGSESAQCYLSIEMARRGHEVFLVTGMKSARSVHGVNCNPLPGALDRTGAPDAVLVTNAPEFARGLRRLLGPEVLIFAWEHNHWNPDPAYSGPLGRPECGRDFILCVSEWQRNQFITCGSLDPGRVFVLRNAVAPYFENLFGAQEDVLAGKVWPPVMAFTSTPYTGLEAATLFFPELRKHNGTVTLNIFSSFDMYAPNNNNRLDPRWQDVYRKCSAMPGVNYIGNVPQKLLARTLKSTLAIFYPNVMPETSSICTMEAMAAGCMVITSALGALPETSAGFGEIVEPGEGGTLSADDFVSRSLILMDKFSRADAGLAGHLRRQVDFANRCYRWEIRAAELERLICERAAQ